MVFKAKSMILAKSIFILSCFMCTQVYGAETNGAQQNAEQLQGYIQQQLELEKNRVLKETQNWRGGHILEGGEPQRKRKNNDANCRIIKSLLVEGSNVISVHSLVAQYEGRCLNSGDIEDILSAITREYVSRGFITTRVYLPQQSLVNGMLTIQVLEGKIEKYHIDESKTPAGNVNLYTTFPSSPGDVLNLRDIEQGIDQINALPSNSATMQIIPGEGEGQSVVSVANVPSSSWRVGVSYDNTGQKATGQDQHGANLETDNPLGLGDKLRLSYQTADPARREIAYSDVFSINYTWPLGYSTFSVGYLETSYRQLQVLPSGNKYSAKGSSESSYGSISRLLYRDQLSKLNLSTTLTQKSSENFFADQPLRATSPDLSVWDVDISAMRLLPNLGMFNLGFGITQGTALFGATHNSNELGSPQAQYQKNRQSLFFNLSYAATSYTLTWDSQTLAQQSKDILYGSEQMSVTGPNAVRGFTTNFLSGNSAFYSRNNFSVGRPVSMNGLNASAKAYVGIDFGSVSPTNITSGRTGQVSGVTIGTQFGFGNASLDVSYSKPMHTLRWMVPEQGVAYVRLKYSFN